MHYYKHLLPFQLFRLCKGVEIVPVIWLLPKSVSDAEQREHDAITKDINDVILDSCSSLSNADRNTQL